MNHSGYNKLVERHCEENIENGELDTTDPILSLQGSGKDIWQDEKADDYVMRLRTVWQ